MMISAASPILASGLMFGFSHATRPGLVICGILIVASVACWTAMLSKVWMVSRAKKANRDFLGAYHHSPHPLAIFQAREHHAHSPLYHIYHSASRELAFHLLGTDEADANFANRLNSAGRIMPSQMKAVVAVMDRAATEAGVRLEAKMSAVSMVLSAAPFFGLLGTVWGVMDVFSDAAVAADPAGLQEMVPGLSAALLPTVIGLLLAVPGMVGYNLLVGGIRALVVRHDHFASEFSSVLERHFVDHRPKADEIPSIGSLVTPNMPAFGSAQPSPKSARAMASTEA